MYEYNQIMRRMGLSTPELSYAGFAKPTDTKDEDYNALLDKYNIDRAKYDAWLAEYKRRQQAWNMYGPDYQGELLGRPEYVYGYDYVDPNEEPTAAVPTTPVPIPTAPSVSEIVGTSGSGDSYGGGNTDPNATRDLTSMDIYGAPTTYGWSMDQAVQDVKDNPLGYATMALTSPIGAIGRFGWSGVTRNLPDAMPGSIMDARAAGLRAEAEAMAGFGMDAATAAADASTAADRAAAGDPMDSFGNNGGSESGSDSDNSGDGASGGSRSGDSSHGDSGASDSGASDSGASDSGASDSGASDSDSGWAKGGLVGMYRKYAEGGEVDYNNPNVNNRGLDLSRVTPEQLAMLQQQDPGALQRGIARFAAPPRQEPSQAATLLELTSKYSQPQHAQSDIDYAAEHQAARQAVSRETEAYNKMLAQAMDQKAEGPSRAEMFFKLAAAFGAPTKTGTIGESLAGASSVLAEHEKGTRAAEAANVARKLELGMLSQKARMDAAKTDLADLRQLAAKELDTQRAQAMELMKVQIQAGKPQSEAGKIAMDQGLQPGTPQYAQFVSKYVADKIESGKLFKEAMISVAQQGANVRQSAENRKVAEQGMLSPMEGKQIATEQTALDAKAMLARNLELAYQLNKKAMSGSGISRATGAVLGAVGFPSERLKAEEELTQNLTQASLDYASRLKPMSDADARLAQKLTGLVGTTPESRAAQIEALYRQTQAEIDQHKARINDVRSRKNRTKTPVEAALEGAE